MHVTVMDKDKAIMASILLWDLPESPHIPAGAITTNQQVLPLTCGNRMHT